MTGPVGGIPLAAELALLPTPQSRDGQGRGTPNKGTAQDRWDSGRRNLDDGIALLPSPTVGDSRGSRNATPSRSAGQEHHHSGTTLSDVPRLLPSPRASVDPIGGPGQRGSAGDLAMPSAVQPEHWGKFAAAVTRHAAIFGPPPAPTEPNRNGAPRLAPAFAEWLMCVPAGHVTDALPRTAALKAIGNGVCPPQLAAAWALLTDTAQRALDTSTGRPVASQPMTTSTTTATAVDETRARSQAINERILAAGDKALAEAFADNGEYAGSGEAVRAGLMELATAWREEAAWWENSGRRGAKGTAKELTQAAARLAGVAVGLKAAEYPKTGTLTISIPETTADAEQVLEPVYAAGEGPISLGPICPHPVEGHSTLRSGAVKCTACGSTIKEGDPTMAYLAGETNIYEPKVSDYPRDGSGLVIIDDPQPMAELLPNPFTSPGLPRRPAPKRLTFADLGPLIGATYPAPRPNLSHSAVERYAGCGVSLLLSDASRAGVLGAQRPSWSRVGGQAFHLAIESIERAILANGGAVTDSAVTVEFWEETFTAAIEAARAQVGDDSPYADTTTWHIANSGREGYDWWRVEGLEMVKRYVAFHDNTWRATHTLLQLGTGPDGGGPYAPVLEFEFNVSAGTTDIPDHGFIDAAWVDLSDPKVAKLDIHDYKAGKSKPDSTDQLDGYASALRRLLPANFGLAIRGTYWLARQGVYTPPVVLDAATSTAKVDYLYRMTKRGIDGGIFVPRTSSFCVSCSAIDYCPTRT